MFPHRQQGTALILALFIISLVAIIAVTMMASLSRDIRRTALLLNNIQAELYAQGSLAWAIDSVRTNWSNQEPKVPIDKMPLSSALHHVQHYFISSTIYDAQSYFNLNNLSNEEWQAIFVRLLLIIEPTFDGETAQKITRSLVNWISLQPNSTEDEAYYSQLPQPYSAPHRPMVSISELRLVRGITPTLYTKISPYVTALPGTTTININSAAAPLLQSLGHSLPPASAQALVKQRQQAPFGNLEQFLSDDHVRHYSFSPSMITINSDFFILKTTVKTKDQKLVLYSLLHRKIINLKPVIEVIWQTKGDAI